MNKLNRVLLIDDDDGSNFVHQDLIGTFDLFNEIDVFESAEEALTYLTTADPETGEFPQPEVIFLDINMPFMDGWAFLEEYQRIPESITKHSHIYMLSSSLHAADAQRAKEHPAVAEFIVKPLTDGHLHAIKEEFSPSLK